MAADFAVDHLGRIGYAEALELQHKCVDARRSGTGPDRLLLLEHPPVITLGRSARRENLLATPAELARRGVEVHEVARGGDITYHAPGQLVGYAILDLAARGRPDVHAFLRELEAGLVEAVSELGLASRVRPGFTGLYADSTDDGEKHRKLASIGVGLRGWVTCHGFALNVDVDLEGFETILACGLHDVEMTSVARELGSLTGPDLSRRASQAVADVFSERWS
jgi:lipoyl(octanoyl) transferase